MCWPLALHLSVLGKDRPNTACLRDRTIHCMGRHANFKSATLYISTEQSTLHTLSTNIATPQHSNAPRLTSTLYISRSTLNTVHASPSTLNTQHTLSIHLHTKRSRCSTLQTSPLQRSMDHATLHTSGHLAAGAALASFRLLFEIGCGMLWGI